MQTPNLFSADTSFWDLIVYLFKWIGTVLGVFIPFTLVQFLIFSAVLTLFVWLVGWFDNRRQNKHSTPPPLPDRDGYDASFAEPPPQLPPEPKKLANPHSRGGAIDGTGDIVTCPVCKKPVSLSANKKGCGLTGCPFDS